MYAKVDLIWIEWYDMWANRRKQELKNEKKNTTVGLEQFSRLPDRRSNRLSNRIFLIVDI